MREKYQKKDTKIEIEIYVVALAGDLRLRQNYFVLGWGQPIGQPVSDNSLYSNNNCVHFIYYISKKKLPILNNTL